MNTPVPIFDGPEFQENPFHRKHFATSAFFPTDATVYQSELDYEFALKFLFSYTGSSATFNSYRRELERLLQWAWFIQKKTVINLRREDIEAFIEFARHPPDSWIGIKNVARFKSRDGLRIANDDWRPYVVSQTKELARAGISPQIENYQLSQSALKATFSVLSSFYGYMIQEGVCEANPVALIRQKSKFLQREQTHKPIRRISNLQWQFLQELAADLADKHPEKYERSLFILNCLLGMYLRISEVVADERATPTMGDFRRDMDGNWWFHVTGKGNKNRIVTVSDEMMDALKRYRKYLSLPPLPVAGERTPLVAKTLGRGAITSTRQIRALLQEMFDLAYEKMAQEGFADDAQDLRSATAHWLRHTGISEDVKTRPREHVRDDAGHASMATTDKYIDSDLRERHASGRRKKLRDI
ncbi:site specific recombinase, phage integrase family [Teredinibacter turnerae T7901]|uniref:Site specific recombinase, phage integrase family n=1 Tax=Teredinibacter turnerae (strain ATCC 39867 / T7901) TaxID=377629 RepID=C5BIK7_TERTT|nr:site-specific integrase [Teredinibacter turnerae]ACR10950.1 site specific recombinase, phage integrase family [Teredinibacter turnerae T7901]